MSRFKDISGKKFGMLTVIEDVGTNKHKRHIWHCKCDCGVYKVIEGASLLSGNTKSCGCIAHRINDDISRRRRENTPNVCGVYKITNPDGDVYIGGSRTVYRRWLRHREARKKSNIHASINKYGWRNHKFELIHVLPSDITDEVLVRCEQVYIDAYRGCGVTMLNIKDAGSSAKFPQESKDRMSLVQRKTYSVMYKGEIIEFTGLKEFCKQRGLSEKCLSDLLGNNGHYYSKNYYRGYSRINFEHDKSIKIW